MILQFLIIALSKAYTFVGETPCTAISQVNCGTTSFYGLGWCYYDTATSSCVNLPCYLMDEVAACRSGGSLPPGGSTSAALPAPPLGQCLSLETFSLQYDNVCGEPTDTQVKFAFVRFVKTTDGFVDKTSDNIAIGILDVSTDIKSMFKLYTINPWLASSAATDADFQTKLLTILDKYAETTTRTQLLTQQRSHPFYLERTVYQGLQLLRDRTVRYKSPVILRQTLLPKIWSVALIGLTRMTTFSPNYYYTNYYFINFAIVPYFRQTLTMDGQSHSLKIDWSGYSFSQNGYVMAYSYPLEQFGIPGTGTYTDVMCIRPFLGTPVLYNDPPQANYDNNFSPILFTYYWTDTSLSILQANLRLYKIATTDYTFTQGASSLINTGVSFTCVTASRYCTTTYTPTGLDGTGQNYFVGDVSLLTPNVGALKRAQCLLQYKTWNIAGNTCS